MYAIDTRLGGTFAFGGERELGFTGILTINDYRDYDITDDGERFIVMVPTEAIESTEPTRPQINVVLNWFEECTRSGQVGQEGWN